MRRAGEGLWRMLAGWIGWLRMFVNECCSSFGRRETGRFFSWPDCETPTCDAS
ncbi:hypothetical protein EV647_6362 [Kribbella sp. VKM Ac-2566]|nr:hypothetical protein EV647_6362 [Kribbella sp. VKM Ac-2566]